MGDDVVKTLLRITPKYVSCVTKHGGADRFFTCRVQFGIAFASSYIIVLKNAAI